MAVYGIPRAGKVSAKGAPLDIAAMLFWMFTVGAGIYLLVAGRPARGPVEGAAAPEPAGVTRTAGVPMAAAAAYTSGAKVPPITHTRITTRPGEHPLLEFMHPALGVTGLGCLIAFVITRAPGFAWASFVVVVATIAAGVTWYVMNARATAPRAEVQGRAEARGGPEAQGRAEAQGARGAQGRAQPQGAEGPNAPGTGSGPPARRYPSRRLLVHGSSAAVTLVLVIVTALIAHHA
jgi:hypothetical protein